MNLQMPANTDTNIIFVPGHQLPFARNHIVHEAKKFNSDYLFFVDADMVFPTNTLIRLLSHDLDMVNALAFRRLKPYYPCIFNWDSDKHCYSTADYSHGLLEVDATGMPAHLIKMTVFDKIPEPWYYYRDNIFSSDLTFCENARKAGYKIMIDTDLKIGHLSEELVITEEFYNFSQTEETKQRWNTDMIQALEGQKNGK
jgi:hypothetical protein